MREIILYILLPFLLYGCQNELYRDPSKDFQSPQGVFISNEGEISIFVEENEMAELNNLTVSLAQKENRKIKVQLEIGNSEQLAAYNKRNGTNYLLLPDEMFDAPSEVTFEPKHTVLSVPLMLKNIKFTHEGVYALPVKIRNGELDVIPGQDEGIIVFEQRIVSKALRINGNGSERNDMFPDGFTVPQWTLEVMVNRSAYVSNNRSICGTKLALGSSMLDEIFTRFGDVTIRPDQLQLKTGSSQIDVNADLFTAKPNTWYMLSFVYDGRYTRIYVNGLLVAEQEIRTGDYGLVGFWIAAANELIREVRFWKIARTPQQILSSVWKMVNPDDENLLLYYPLNGKKNDRETGSIEVDETMLWDWSKSEKHLSKPRGSIFDNNGDLGFVFPAD